MSGLSDFASAGYLNYLSGSLTLPTANGGLTPPPVFMALFTTAPTSDAGTGGTEVTGGSYARQQIAGALTTNGTTAAGSPVLNFASVPTWIRGPLGTGVVGMQIRDATSAAVIPANTTLVSATATTVTMSNNAAGAGVGGTDVITFSCFAPATASSGGEPSATPGAISNTNAIVTFVQATAPWGTVSSFGFYDAVTSGNFQTWDYVGNFKWLPFSCTSASPGVLTSPAHGYANGDTVVVTTKYGGTLPTTGGSWSGLLTVANVTTDTFTVGVNTTGTGEGQVRKVVPQPVAINVTLNFPAGQLTVSGA
jgi:hypothetical protein